MDQNLQNQGGTICFCRRCNGIVHQVQRGDTLYAMSRRYGVPVGEIISANPFINIYNLRIGQEVCIPIRTPQPRTGMMNMPNDQNPMSDVEDDRINSMRTDMTTDMTDDMYQMSNVVPEEEPEEEPEEIEEADDMQQMSRDDMVLTGEEKLSDVLEQYDMDIEDFVRCITREI